MTDHPGVPTQRGPVATPPALEVMHLVDTSVWSKVRPDPALTAWFNDEVRAGRVATCGVVVLELLRSARNTASFRMQAELLMALEHGPEGSPVAARAREVQTLLAERGLHRGIPPADLLIAASAEAASLPVLHYDRDYDLIAGVTSQPTAWVLPAGSLP